jgi:hypothetical protein
LQISASCFAIDCSCMTGDLCNRLLLCDKIPLITRDKGLTDMRNGRGFRFGRWASLAFVAGGLLMVVLWLIYTTVHGPTSFDQTRAVLGRSTLFWSLLLSVPPSLLVALGLIILYPRLASSARLMPRIGYALTMIGLVVPAGLDLFVWGGLGPPFFVPVVATGLILLALGNWHNPQLQRQSLYLLMLIGILQAIAFALAMIPLEVSDQIGGYRIYGLFAHFLTGIGWIALGVNFWKTPAAIISEPVQN